VMYHVEKTAAEAVQFNDMFEKENFAKGSSKWRTLKSVAITGSNAAGDCKFDVIIGQTIVSDDQPNSSTGLLTDRTEAMIINRAIPPSTPISCICVDDANTNPVHIYIQIEPRKQYRRRRYYRRRR
jgi:hypothetical protein